MRYSLDNPQLIRSGFSGFKRTSKDFHRNLQMKTKQKIRLSFLRDAQLGSFNDSYFERWSENQIQPLDSNLNTLTVSMHMNKDECLASLDESAFQRRMGQFKDTVSKMTIQHKHRKRHLSSTDHLSQSQWVDKNLKRDLKTKVGSSPNFINRMKSTYAKFQIRKKKQVPNQQANVRKQQKNETDQLIDKMRRTVFAKCKDISNSFNKGQAVQKGKV